jgi:hypothetical protein
MEAACSSQTLVHFQQCNEEDRDLYSSPAILRLVRMVTSGWYDREYEMHAYRVSVLDKRSLGRPRWEYNIQIDLRETGYEERMWMEMV